MKKLFSILAVLVVFMVIAVPVSMAQEATPSPEATADAVVVDEVVGESPVVVVENGNSPGWYLLAIGAIIFFATFAQYNLERMSGKSMRELSNSVPTHVITLLLNGGSYLARLTQTEADDKGLLEVGKRFGYIPNALPDGSILWSYSTPTPLVKNAIPPTEDDYRKWNELMGKKIESTSGEATPNG